MTIETRMSDPRDRFPVGMRVLAVDDDPTCLLLLETLLRRCQYQVTTASQAVVALKLLRENKDKFDLVISDVHMPDMDGFKLLELVGLEMDLPVIMLSANGDTNLVMKGITHGACDYLLKPIRIEELKNIWQHVVRRKKFDSKDGNGTGKQDRPHFGGGEGGLPSVGTGNSDHNGKATKKRKDQNEAEDDENENGHDNEDPTTQKKSRVVWSVELHRKFVAAVNQLGIDKAVPKKILELMNVEKLTRENVASHLQKYRLYLKRISCVANQQANMAAALGSTDPSHLRMSSLNALENLQTLTGSGRFHNPVFRSYPTSGMLGWLNTTPSSLGMQGLPSSGIVQLGHLQNLNNSTNGRPNLQLAILHGRHNGCAFEGLSTSSDPIELQQNKSIACVENLTLICDHKTQLPISNGLLDAKPNIGCSRKPLLGITESTSVSVSRTQDASCERGYKIQPSVSVTSVHPEFSSSLPDRIRSANTWSTSLQSAGTHANSYQSSDRFKQPTLHQRDNISSIPLHTRNNPFDVSSMSSFFSQSQGLRTDMQSPGNLSIIRNAEKVIGDIAFQGWDDYNASPYHSSIFGSDINPAIPVNDALDPPSQTLEPKASAFNSNFDLVSIDHSNDVDPLNMRHDAVNKSVAEMSSKPNQGYITNQHKTGNSCLSNNLGSLEDLVSAVMKQEQDNVRFVEGDFGYDNFSLGKCM